MQPRPLTDEDYRPLYRQVYDYVIKRIVGGTWRAGEMLPHEHELAEGLSVSPGTVRKALDILASEKLIDRRQGKGTYVALNTPERSLLRFFRLRAADGQRGIPTSSEESISRRAPTREEVTSLKLGAKDAVFEINRVRRVNETPVALERVVIPVKLFPNIEKRRPLPNALYSVYQHDYGVHVTRVDECVRADLANRRDARCLGIQVGAPLLHVERLAFSMSGDPIECRTKRCDTRNMVYAITLS